MKETHLMTLGFCRFYLDLHMQGKQTQHFGDCLLCPWGLENEDVFSLICFTDRMAYAGTARRKNKVDLT